MIDFPDIFAAVAEVSGLSVRQINGRRRDAKTYRARMVVYDLAREEMGAKLTCIGRATGRDHTSVLHGINRCAELRVTDPEFERMHRDAKAMICGNTAFRAAMFRSVRGKADSV
jgi:chromosomal replication initiator protein